MIKGMKFFAILGIVTSVFYGGCSKDDGDHHGGMHHGKSDTQIVTEGNTQVAFDFLGKKGHEEMMKGMNIDSKTVQDSDRFVLITIMDKAEHKLIMDAKVKVVVTGPNGKTIESTIHQMTGGGMHHYTAGFATPVRGEYKIEANIDIKGKVLRASAFYKAE